MAAVQPGEVFFYEPDILPYFLTPPLVISFLTTLLSIYYFSPLLSRTLIQAKENHSVSSNVLLHSGLSSTVHAIISSSLSVYLLVNGLIGTNRIFSKSPLGFTTIQISLGRYLCETIYILLNTEFQKDVGTVLHHIAVVVGLCLCLFYQGIAMFFVVYRFTAEISTPCGHLRMLLSHLGYKDGFLYVLTAMSALVLFIMCRIIVIPWHWYELLTTISMKECTLLMPLPFMLWLLLIYITFDILNTYWCYRIIRGAYKLCTRLSKRKAG